MFGRIESKICSTWLQIWKKKNSSQWSPVSQHCSGSLCDLPKRYVSITFLKTYHFPNDEWLCCRLTPAQTLLTLNAFAIIWLHLVETSFKHQILLILTRFLLSLRGLVKLVISRYLWPLHVLFSFTSWCLSSQEGLIKETTTRFV